jgi:RNA ligase
VKIKQDDYVQLHKLVTGLNEKTVWEHLRDHGNIDALVEGLPDEFHEWTRETSDRLRAQFNEIYDRAWGSYRGILNRMPSLADQALDDRKTFALEATKEPTPALLFMLWDGYAKESPKMQQAIWRMIRPDPKRTLMTVTEDTA